MPLLNSFLQAFFRSHFVSQCSPVHDHILLVPTTEVLTTTRDRESGVPSFELATSDEFLGSHVLRIQSSEDGNSGNGPIVGRESRTKARLFSTINGRSVVIKDSWIYSNKGFRSLSQAQLLNDVCYYPDVLEPQQWLIYYISRPLIGSLEPIPMSVGQLHTRMSRNENAPKSMTHTSILPSSSSSFAATRKKSPQSFSELLLLFPMIARQMQPGFEKIFKDFSKSFEKPLPPSPPHSAVPSVSSTTSSPVADNEETNGVSFASLASPKNEFQICSEANEITIRKALDIAVASGIELFQKIDQPQLSLLASSTDLTGPIVEKLIERYISEQLHDSMLFPRVCAAKRVEDEELEKKIKSIENVDLTQIGLPSFDKKTKLNLVNRLTRGITVFQKVASAKSPHAMTEVLLETAQELTKIDDASSQSTEGLEVKDEKTAYKEANSVIVTMNADMLVSLLLIVVIRSKVSHLTARLSYMKNYIFVDDVEAGETGYLLSTFEAVLYHIAHDSDQLSLASSRNKELWKCVKKGNIDGLKNILDPPEVESKITENDGAVSSITNQHRVSENNNKNGTRVGEETGNDESDSALPAEAIHTLTGNRDGEETGLGLFEQVEGELTTKPDINTTEALEGKARALEDNATAAFLKGEGGCIKGSPKPLPKEADELSSLPGGLFLNHPDALLVATETPHDAVPEGGRVDSMAMVQSLPRNGLERADSGPFMYADDNRDYMWLPKSRSAASLATTFRDTSSLGQLSRKFSAASQTKELSSLEKLSKTRNPNGDSILMMAIQERQAHLLQYLLDSKYFPTQFVLEDDNNDGTTLLAAAVQHQDNGVMEVLLDLLLKIPVRELREYLQRTDNDGRTAAHYLFNYPDLIEKLGRYLPWKQRDKNGQTPLFALCRSYDHPLYREMVTVAIKVAQDAQGDQEPLHLDDHVDSRGNTLLHIASDQTILKFLLKCDAEVNSVNDKGFTPLMLASKYGRVDSVRTFFADQRVDILAKELRGLTAVELAKDDDVRNRIDDLVLFQNPPLHDGRVTAVVRSFFVEDATVRFVVKSAAPSGNTTLTITTCRRSLADFEFLAQWLSHEHPASWIPSLQNDRSPFQIPSKPSRAVLREIQLKVDFFLKTLLAHPTFSTHELLWEFFLVPEIQTEQMIERSKRKAENRAEKIKEEYTPVEDTKEVELFVSYAKDTLRSMTYAFRSVIRRGGVVKSSMIDLADAYKLAFNAFSSQITFLPPSYPTALLKFTDVLTPNESHPHTIFINDLRHIQSSLTGVMTALDRPRIVISELANLQKKVDRHLVSLRRSDRWPLGLLDDTRQKYHDEAAENVNKAREEFLGKASELRYTHTIAAAELAAYNGMHEGMLKRAFRNLASRSLVVERARLESMRRVIKGLGEGLKRGKEGHNNSRDKDIGLDGESWKIYGDKGKRKEV